MRVALIGRTQALYNSGKRLLERGYSIPLVITSKAAPEYTVDENDFRDLANANESLFICTPKINTKDVIEKIKSLGEIDVAISINYSGIIASEVINLFRFGIINAHGGDLPRYRGNACQAWAIINGETEVGLCIHKMIGGELDSGDIWERKKYSININTRIGEIYNWFENDIPDLMLTVLDRLKNDTDFQPTPQSKNPSDILRCYPRTPDDGLIDWNHSNIQIVRLVNASSEPYSGAFTYMNGTKVIIWRAELFDCQEKYLAVPGQIAVIDKINGRVLVITGKGIIAITEVEVDGWRGSPSNYFQSIRSRFK